MGKRPFRLGLWLLIFGCGVAVVAAPMKGGAAPQPAVYYVDYAAGDDANSGTSSTAAWKHAPGDPEAVGTPASIALQPGDQVLFKGGVVYRGQVALEASGAAGAPISYVGNGWGAERAILDGSELVTGTWVPCPSQAACGDNPNWQEIHSIEAPPGYGFFTPIYDVDDFLWFSQDPNPSDPFYYDRIADYRVVPIDDPSITMTRTSLTDPRHLTQDDSGYWDDAFIAAWRIPNVVVYSAITGFDPATDTIYFEDLGGDLYTDRDGYYSILNHLSFVDTPGEYAFDPAQNRIYTWPAGGGDPGSRQFTVAVRRVGIDIAGHSHLSIEGLTIQKYFADFDEWNCGKAVHNSYTWTEPAVDVSVVGNRVTKLRSMVGQGAIGFSNVDGVEIRSNHIFENQRNVGVLASGDNIIVADNTIRKNTRNGVWFMGAHNSQIVRNSVTDIQGSHANAISVYLGSSDVLVAANHVTAAPSPFTFEASSDLTIVGNVFDGGDGLSNVNEWGDGSSGVITFVNNTLVRNSRNAALNIGNGGADLYIIKNNIVDGSCPNFAISDLSHNIYTGLEWCQSVDDFQEGELLEEDLDVIFADAAGADFRLVETSPAIDAGTDVSAYLPIADFPDFDFFTDLAGVERPQGSAWDIGAYEGSANLIFADGFETGDTSRW